MKKLLCLGLFVLMSATVFGQTSPKIGVLLVSHGSRLETWRQALFALEDSVRPALLANAAVRGFKTAFMEYTEPPIATRLKEFDTEGFIDLIIVPVFLIVSSFPVKFHSPLRGIFSMHSIAKPDTVLPSIG